LGSQPKSASSNPNWLGLECNHAWCGHFQPINDSRAFGMVGQIDCSPWQSDSLSVPRHGCYNDHQASVPFTIRTGSLSRRSADHACLLNLTINFNLPLRFFHHTDREKSHVMASFSLAPIPMYRVDSGEEPHSGSILPPLALSKTRFKTRKTGFSAESSSIALTPLPKLKEI